VFFWGSCTSRKTKSLDREISTVLRFDDNIEASCPICLDDFSFSDGDTQVQKLVCGHAHCTGCLHQFLVTAPERNRFPPLCIGNEDRCQVPIPIPIIQSLLSPLEFDSLVDKAPNGCIGLHAEQYKYCLTQICSQLYRVTKDAIISTCPSCTLSLCAACRKPEHSGMPTCAERRLRIPQCTTRSTTGGRRPRAQRSALYVGCGFRRRMGATTSSVSVVHTFIGYASSRLPMGIRLIDI